MSYMNYHHHQRSRRINEEDVPESKHTIFIRGLPGSMSTNDIKNFFEDKVGPVSFDFVRSSPDNIRLFVAVRFETRDDAKLAMKRFSEDDILGHKCDLTWFKDIRRFAQYKAIHVKNRGRSSSSYGRKSYRNSKHRDRSRSRSSSVLSSASTDSRKTRSRTDQRSRSSSRESYNYRKRYSDREDRLEDEKRGRRREKERSSRYSRSRSTSSEHSKRDSNSPRSLSDKQLNDDKENPETMSTSENSETPLLLNKSEKNVAPTNQLKINLKDVTLKILEPTTIDEPAIDDIDSPKSRTPSPNIQSYDSIHEEQLLIRKTKIRSESTDDVNELQAAVSKEEPSSTSSFNPLTVKLLPTSLIPKQVRSSINLPRQQTENKRQSISVNVEENSFENSPPSKVGDPTAQTRASFQTTCLKVSQYFHELKDIQNNALMTVKAVSCSGSDNKKLRLSNLSKPDDLDDELRSRLRDEKITSLNEIDLERFLVKKKKLELAFRNDCDTFAFVAKKLLEKDDSLEKPLRIALIENFEELEKQFMEKIDGYLP